MKIGATEQTIAVIKFVDGWRLLPSGPAQQVFTCRADAVRSALSLVQLAQAAGRTLTLLVHEEFGEFRRVDAATLLREHSDRTARVPPRLRALQGPARDRRSFSTSSVRAWRGVPCETVT